MDNLNIVIFGAGKIGRSFIGQLFGRAGYEIIFVDMDLSLVKKLNRRRQYPVIIKGTDFEEKLVIENVRSIHALQRNEVIDAFSQAGIVAVSVGKSALPAIAPVVAEGLIKRKNERSEHGVDIILAENMRSADLYFREKLREKLPPTYPLDDLVGLVETSIGKMVPIMTASDLEEDPLQVFAEPYNTLILDRKGFRGEIPEIPEFSLKDNMKAWVDRKAFIHNLGHATAAYEGHLRHPEAIYMYEVLDDEKVYGSTKKVMHQAAQILMAIYPGEFTEKELSDHIDDLLMRFQNRNLGDTVFRVGSDLKRKLGRDDRFMGVIRIAEKYGLPCGIILKAMSLGFKFMGKDENGRMLSGDEEFHGQWNQDRDRVLENICGLSGEKDSALIMQLKKYL